MTLTPAVAPATSPQPGRAELLLTRARELAPYLQSKSAEINSARRLPQEVGDRLTESGLWTIMRPGRFGGDAEVKLDLMYRITQVLAAADASVSWVYVVLNTHDHMLGFFPEHIQEEYWGSARPKCASSFNPTGKATPVDGGFRLNGKWSFCSGIDFCDWVIPGAIVGMLPGEPPVPDMRYFLVPTAKARIVDDWHVIGLKGTGSKTIILEDVFVPNDRILTDEQIRRGTTPGASIHDGAAYRVPGWAVFIFSLSAIPVPAVRSAYEEFKADSRGRAARHEPPFELRKPAVQMCLAEASVLLDSAQMLYDRALTETFAAVYATGDVPQALRQRNRRDLNYSVLTARRVSEMLMSMGGGRVTLETGKVQRAMRDVYALSAHPSMNWDTPALSYGGVELGATPTDPFC